MSIVGHCACLVRDLGQTVHGPLAKDGRITRNGGLGLDLTASNPPVQCDDEFAKSVRHVGEAHRHGTAPLGLSWRRPMFHTSPHRLHRQ